MCGLVVTAELFVKLTVINSLHCSFWFLEFLHSSYK